ncbi:UNVERIFIED_CONTAM: hypothetical protein Sindi_2117000 [Sesamum indicum]
MSHRCLPRATDQGVVEFVACECTETRQWEERDILDARNVDGDCKRLTCLWDGVWMEFRWCYGVSSLYGRHTCNLPVERLTGEQIRESVEEFSPAVEVSMSLPDRYRNEHKWTKKSIFWDLKYWSTHMIRHNLDVMHIEKNVFDTVMDIKKKMKDARNVWKDLNIICGRPK